jgi:hypothetical protein
MMSEKIIVEDRDWERVENGFKFSLELEKGNILFFPKIPFSFPQDEIDFLLKQRQTGVSTRKNIAYKPQIDQVTNHESVSSEDRERLHEILKNYSSRVTQFLELLLPSYANHWKLDYASFRPFQEKGRKLRLRARNDLLHVDSFPTRPLNGSRILRFFTNINPIESRLWITSDLFKDLVEKYVKLGDLRLPQVAGYSLKDRLVQKMKGVLKSLGVKIPVRSPYDHFMLNMHNYLKENDDFQKNCVKTHWEFPPNSCWAVFTDQVSHAAISGQYALEQTLLIPRHCLLHPEESPVSILERLTGKSMVCSAVH